MVYNGEGVTDDVGIRLRVVARLPQDRERFLLAEGSLAMRRGFKQLTVLMLFGVMLLAPLFLSCSAASVAVPDPTPLEAETEDEEEEGEEQGG